MVAMKAIVLGGTGAVGQQIVKYLKKCDEFISIRLISRRTIDIGEDIGSEKIARYFSIIFEQRVIDFDAIDTHLDDFKDADVVFCALGTTRGKSGAKGFYKVDHDYVVGCAKACHEAGVQHFSLVSSSGANEDSSFLYPKTKGQTEREVRELGFKRCTIARPGLLEHRNADFRVLEILGQVLLLPIKLLGSKRFSVPVDVVAKAMIYDSLSENKEAVTVIENSELYDQAKHFEEIPSIRSARSA
ncbi:hypothetical protein AB6A40_009954 [Gnathostoma spinigerum]|uniref:Protein HTATIP2 n=1 Tax=Gnathostoma spinigerum TaxID=75299 RepID=A0ABD6EUQ3_9BILA